MGKEDKDGPGDLSKCHVILEAQVSKILGLEYLQFIIQEGRQTVYLSLLAVKGQHCEEGFDKSCILISITRKNVKFNVFGLHEFLDSITETISDGWMSGMAEIRDCIIS